MKPALTVVAFPPDPDALELLVRLSAAHLLHPVVLVGDGCAATLLDRGHLSTVNVFAELATQRPGRVRFVAVTLARTDGAARVASGRELATKLRERCRDSSVAFSAVALGVTAEGGEVPASCFHADWEANLVMAPDDATGSPGMPAVDLHDTALPAAAATAAATIGGLWTWMTSAPFDDAAIAFAEGRRVASVARHAVRIVDAGPVAHDVVRAALDLSGSWPVPAGCVRHGDTASAVAALSARIAAAPEVAFGYRPAPSWPAPVPTPVGVHAALALFLRRLWRHIRVIPGDLLAAALDRARGAIESALQARTFGDDSEIAVRFGGRPVPSDEAPPHRPGSPHVVDVPGPATNVTTWSVVRSAVLGCLDGSDFGGTLAGAELSWRGQRAVVTAPDVAPADEHRGTLLSGLGEHLADGIAAAHDDLDRADDLLARLPEELDELDRERLPASRRARRWAIGLVVLLVVALALTALAWTLLPVVVALAVAVLTCAGAVAVGSSLVRQARRLVRLEYRLRELTTRPERLLAWRRHAAVEHDRLRLLAEQLSDWGAICTDVVRRPFGTIAGGDDNDAHVAPLSTGLLSVTFGVPVVDDDTIAGAVSRLRRQTFRRGWLTAEYVALLDAWSSRYRVRVGDDPHLPSSVEADVSPARERPPGADLDSPRTQLHADLAAGRHSDLLDRRAAELERRFSDGDAQQLVDRVASSVPALDGTVDDFLGELITCRSSPGFTSSFGSSLPPVPTTVHTSVICASPRFAQRARAGVVAMPSRHRGARLVLGALHLNPSEETPIDLITHVRPDDPPGRCPVAPAGGPLL